MKISNFSTNKKGYPTAPEDSLVEPNESKYKNFISEVVSTHLTPTEKMYAYTVKNPNALFIPFKNGSFVEFGKLVKNFFFNVQKKKEISEKSIAAALLGSMV